MKYYKIKIGFEKGDFIPITEKELEKALYTHITGAKGVFENGTISGANIISILPDYNRAMGWNDGHVLDEYDLIDINRKLGNKYENCIAEAKSRVNYFIQTKQLNLIGTGTEILKIDNPLSEEVKNLADSKRLT